MNNTNKLNMDTRSEKISEMNTDLNFTGGWLSGFIQSLPYAGKKAALRSTSPREEVSGGALAGKVAFKVKTIPLINKKCSVRLKPSLIRNYRTTPSKSLTPFLDQALIGLILGDVFVQRRKPHHNSYLQFNQGFINKDYVDHLYVIFSEFCSGKVKIETYLDKRNNREYTSVKFNTRSFKCFNKYRELFYQEDRTKRIPKNIKDLLTPISLAYLFLVVLLIVVINLIVCFSPSETNLLFTDPICLSAVPLLVNNKKLIPAKTYLNADKDKLLIYEENRKKIGVYC